jgi:hypothetical protein
LKYLFVLLILAAVAGLVYWRLRPYINGVRRFLGVLREVRGMSSGTSQQNTPARPPAHGRTTERLMRCASCGTWFPSSRAAGSQYCSHACLERAADAPRRTHKSAS